MEKPKIFMCVEIFVLTIASIFVTRGNKQFNNQYEGTLYYGENSSSNEISKASPGCGTSSVLYTVKSSSTYQSIVPFLNGIAIGYDGSGYITLYF
jgi:hypothetical protein